MNITGTYFVANLPLPILGRISAVEIFGLMMAVFSSPWGKTSAQLLLDMKKLSTSSQLRCLVECGYNSIAFSNELGTVSAVGPIFEVQASSYPSQQASPYPVSSEQMPHINSSALPPRVITSMSKHHGTPCAW